MKTLMTAVVATVLTAAPLFAQESGGPNAKGFITGLGGFASSLGATTGNVMVEGGVRIAPHVMIFGNGGRFGNLQADLQPTLDAATAALSASQGLSVTGAGSLPAWYTTGGVRVEVPAGHRILPYVLGSVGVARLNPSAQFAFSSGTLPDGSTPERRFGRDHGPHLHRQLHRPAREHCTDVQLRRRRADSGRAALGRRRRVSLLADCRGHDAECVAARHEWHDLRIRLPLLIHDDGAPVRLTTASHGGFATPRRMPAAAGTLAAGVLLLVFALDRTTGSAPVQHLYYLPIILAAVRFGMTGGIAAGAVGDRLVSRGEPAAAHLQVRGSGSRPGRVVSRGGDNHGEADAGRQSAAPPRDDGRSHGSSTTCARSKRGSRRWCARPASRAPPSALLVLDVDRLKDLNDRYGHLTGAEAVRTVGHLIAQRLPPDAVACRYGGDEFVVAVPQLPDVAGPAGRRRSASGRPRLRAGAVRAIVCGRDALDQRGRRLCILRSRNRLADRAAAETSKRVSRYSGPQTPRSIERRPGAAIRSAWPEETVVVLRKRPGPVAEPVGVVDADPGAPAFAQNAARPNADASAFCANLNASVEELTAQGLPERRAGAGHGLRSDGRPRARRYRPGHRAAAQHRLGRDCRPRRLHHHQRARRRRREARAGRAAPGYDGERARALAGDVGQPDRRRAHRRHGERYRSRAAQGRGLGPARAAPRRLRRHPAGRDRVRVRQSRGAAQLGHDGRRQLGGAAARSRQPDDLYPDGRADQSGQQRRAAGERGRRARRVEHVHPDRVGRQPGAGLRDSERDRRVGVPAAEEVRTPAPRADRVQHAGDHAGAGRGPRTCRGRPGVMVSDVLPDSAAEEAGLGIEDVVDDGERKAGGERADALARVEPVRGRRDGDAGPSPRRGDDDRRRSPSGNCRIRSTTVRAGRSREEGSVPKLGIIGIDVGGRDGARCCPRCAFHPASSWSRARECRPATRCRWSPAT